MKLLLIEDSRNYAFLVETMLAGSAAGNFSVAWEDNLAKAIERLQQDRPDVILLDLSLPDSDGLATLVQLQPAAQEVPIVVLTGYADETLALEALRCGAQDYLVKTDIDKRGLLRAIRYAIGRKSSEVRLERQRQRQAALSEIHTANTSAVNFWSVLQASVDQIGALDSQLAITLWVKNEESCLCEAFAAWNVDDNPWLSAVRGREQSIIEVVAQSGMPVVIDDLAAHFMTGDDYVKPGAALISYLGLPLIIEDQAIGVLGFFSRRRQAFNSEDQEFLTAIAGQVALAIHKSRLQDRALAQAIRIEKVGEEIREAHVKYGELVESINAIVWEVELATWRFTFVNKVAEKMLGYPVERWLEDFSFWVNLIHPDDRSWVVDSCRSASDTGKDHELEYRVVAADSRLVWLRDQVRVITDKVGKPTHLRGVKIDITPSKQAEAARRAHEHEIQGIREISREVFATDDVKSALESILEFAMALGGYDVGAIRLLNSNGQLDEVYYRGYKNPESIRLLRDPTSEDGRHMHSARLAGVLAAGKTNVYENIQSRDGVQGFKREGVCSAVVVPIATPTVVLGVLQVGIRHLVQFQSNQIRLLEVLGSHIGIVVQKARLYDESRRNFEHITSMRQFEHAMVSTLDLRSVINILLERMGALSPPGTAIFIQLFDHETGTLEYFATHDVDENAWVQRYGVKRTVATTGLTRLTLESDAPVQIFDLQSDPHLMQPDFARSQGLTSYLGVQLRVKEQPVGTVGIFTRKPHRFSPEEITDITSLTPHAAIAIHNAKLYENIKHAGEKAAVLREINLAITSSLDLDTQINVLLDNIARIFPTYAITLRLVNEETGIFDGLACRGLDENDWEYTTPSNIHSGYGEVVRLRRAVKIVEAQNDPRIHHHEFLKRNGLVSYLGVPLVFQEEVLGVLGYFAKEPHDFKDDEIQFMTTLAEHVAIAIHNARLYAAVDKQSQELAALLDVSMAASRSLEVELMLREVVRKIAEIFDFDAVRVLLTDEQKEELRARASYEKRAGCASSTLIYKAGQGISGAVAASGNAVVIENLDNDPRYEKLTLTKTAIRIGQKFIASFPIKYQQRCLGALNCVGLAPRRLTDHEVRLITSMTSQIAVAVENARLYEQSCHAAEELSALFDVAAASSQSLEMDRTLDEAISRMNDIFLFDATRFFVLDDRKEELVPRAGHANPGDFLNWTGSLKKGQGIVGHVAATGDPVIIGDTLADQRFIQLSFTGYAKKHGLRFIAGFPVKYNAAVLGVIMCIGRNPRQLTTHEIRLIESMSSQIAVAVANASLYEQTKDQAEQLRNLAAHLESVREHERTRISREIHDELGQTLTALKFDVSWIRRKLSKDQLLSARLSEMSASLDGAIHAIREISARLRPDILDKFGLTAAIEWQLHEFRKRTGIQYHFACDPSDLQLDERQSTALFRIFQETLTNVARHSRASRVRIDLQLQDGTIVLRVDDDGGGIRKDKIFDEHSLGLLGMRERAAVLGGSVTVEQNRSRGTTVTAQLPAEYSTEASELLGRREL
jgi:PAS domain S-box-containing protein